MDKPNLFSISRSTSEKTGDGAMGDLSNTIAAHHTKTRAQTIQRLQVGVVGIVVMVLVIALAATLTQRAQSTEEAAVPDAAPTTEPVEAEPQSDPLADAGVVPELPEETDEEAQSDPALVPEQGGAGADGKGAADTEVADTEAQ